MNKYLSSILSSSLGNILEWYDFGLFAIYSSLFSHLFFPAKDPRTALIATIGIFSIGFIFRPVGALIFGYLGDRYGRANTLRLSILMIALPTLYLGFLPTYDQVGIIAPILLMLIRIWQGISIGGEYSGNLIYLAENSPMPYRATITSFASMGANLGILLAAVVGILTTHFFSKEILETWGWRIPYLASGIFCLLIYKYRLQLPESAIFTFLKHKHLTTIHPIKYIFTHNLPQLFRTIGLVCMGSTFYYFCFIYLPIYLTDFLHLSPESVSIGMSELILLMIFLLPLAGFICDKVGRRKMLLFNAMFVAVITVPGFYFLQHSFYYYLIPILFTLASTLEQGTTSISVVENFPPPARYTGLALGYNIGNGFLGGTVPIVCTWLLGVTHSDLSPAYYIMFCALITFATVFFSVSETKNVSLAASLK